MVVPLPGPTEAGLKLQVFPAGRPEQDAAVKLIVPLYPLAPVMVIIRVAVPPEATVRLGGAGGAGGFGKTKLKSGPMTAAPKPVTKLATSNEPRPVAKLKVAVAVQQGRTLTLLPPEAVQFGVPGVQGSALVPVMAWKIQDGVTAPLHVAPVCFASA